MEALNVSRRHEIILPKGEQKSFCAMTFDGCHFHFVERNERCIYRYNQKFEHVDVIKLSRSFTGICYDHTDGCFWGFEDKSEDTLVRLDRNFREVETLRLRNYTRQGRHIVGISHCCERNILTLSYQNSIFEVSKQGDHRPVLFKEPCVDIMNHCSIAPYYGIARREGRQQRVGFFDRRGHMARSVEIPCEFKVGDIVHFPCHNHTDFDLMVLVTRPCRGQSILFFEMTGMCIHDCHSDICRRHCEEHCGKGEREEHRGGRCQHLWELIESVAKVEASIAHILNGESEKLRKAVRMADSIDELLDINRSVNKALSNITRLEYNLQSTLEFAGDILDETWSRCKRRGHGHRGGHGHECRDRNEHGRHEHGHRDTCRDGHRQIEIDGHRHEHSHGHKPGC